MRTHPHQPSRRQYRPAVPVTSDISSVCAKRRLRTVEQAEAVRRVAGEIYSARRNHFLPVARWNPVCEADAEEAVQEAFAAFIES
jgi:hypothetical protein